MMFCLLGQVRILKTSKVFKLNPKINNIVNVKKKKTISKSLYDPLPIYTLLIYLNG